MKDAIDAAVTSSDPNPKADPEAVRSGWYLYGITWLDAQSDGPLEPGRRDLDLDAAEPVARSSLDNEPVQRLGCGDLAAIVKPVSLAEFDAEAGNKSNHDAGSLEAMVRSHNEIIATIHREQAVLPAKFGCVYPHTEDLRAALEHSHDALVAQLKRLEGCDEWAVHIYVDRPTIQQGLNTEHPTIRQLQQQLATASPGRAYFLQRKLADELAVATDQALNDLAQSGYDHLARRAVAGQVNPIRRATSNVSGDWEILRAAYLVRRSNQGTFIAEIQILAESQEGLRCEYSGPWPPYSFAALTTAEEPR
jgi:hypothetical protein